MSKHVAFWIGVFAAGLVIMPVALGIWAVAQGFAQDIAVSLFIIIAVLVFLLVVVLFLRGPILRRLVGRGEATVEEVSSSLISGVSAAVRGDVAKAEVEADALARAALGWYAWSSFYRWVIATALGLLLAFASFTGTVLLFEQLEKLERQTTVMDAQRELMVAQTAFMESQTARLQEQTEQAAMQNEIMTLSLVNQLREQMLATIEVVTVRDVWGSNILFEEGDTFIRPASGTCGLGLNRDFEMRTPPSNATLAAIAQLGETPRLSERIQNAMRVLLLDREDPVALGAMIVLDQLGYPVSSRSDGQGVVHRYSAIYAPDLVLLDDTNVWFEDSIVSASCSYCQMNALGSITEFERGHAMMDRMNRLMNSGHDMQPLVVADHSLIMKNGGTLAAYSLNIMQHDVDFDPGDLQYVMRAEIPRQKRTLRLRGRFGQTKYACEGLRMIADTSRLFDFRVKIRVVPD